MSFNKMKWHPILDEYAKYLVCDNKAKRTIETYRYRVQHLLNWTQKEPEELEKEDIDNFKHFLRTALDKDGNNRYDDNSLTPYAGAINHFMTFLGKNDIHFKALSKRTKPIIPLSVEEIGRLVQEAKTKRTRDYAIICTMYYGALRISDCLNLDISDVDYERKKLNIRNSKGRYSDEINIHPIALEAIKTYIETEREKFAGDTKALFISEKKKARLNRNVVWKMVREYAVEAKITTKVNTHIFRHSMLTHMAENGATIPQLMRQSRHRDVKSVMKYIHLADKNVEDVYNQTAPSILPSSSPQHQKVEVVEPQPVEQKVVAPVANSNVESNNLLETAMTIFSQGKMTEATFNRMLDMMENGTNTNRAEKKGENLGYFS